MDLPGEKIAFAETTDRDAVQSFFLGVGYGAEVHSDDRLLVARAGHSIVAAVRLCTEEGNLVLRGMYVAEERRRSGIGSRLLESTSAVIGSSECWCIPYRHLADFYSWIGFRMCEGEFVPPFLAKRLEGYLAGGNQVVVMKRPGQK